MKLLYISQDKYPPYRADVAVLFGKELPKLGMEVDWILQSDEELDVPVLKEDDGSKVYIGASCNAASLASKIKNRWLAFKTDLKIFSFAKEKNYDFIQVKDKFITAIIGLIAARIYGVKFVYWISFPLAETYIHMYQNKVTRFPLICYLRGVLSKFLVYKIIIPMSQHVFVQSDQMKIDVMAEGISGDKLTPVLMGVDMEEIPYSQEGQRASEGKVVLYLGTLNRDRHIEFLINVMANVLKNTPDAVLYLVGKGVHPGDEKIILDEIKKYSLEKSVIMTGFLPMEEAWQYVKKADVCVSPFYPTPILNSTSPTKLIEYMAMSKPVVVNSHPEQKLVIDESKGGLCVEYEAQDFANAIIYILNNMEEGEAMGKRGRDYVREKRSYKLIAKNVMNKYHDLQESINK